jgi:hypothetical protein
MEVSRSPSGGRYQRLAGSQRRSRSSDSGSDSDPDASDSGDVSDTTDR